MRIINVGPTEACVILKTQDLQRLTGLEFLDYPASYPRANQLEYAKAGGMTFDLAALLSSVYEVKCMFEQKETILNNLTSMAKKVEGATWPARRFEVAKAEDVTPKTKKEKN